MTSEEIVVRCIDTLEAASIPYMVVGSLSSDLYAIPQSTPDADFAVQADTLDWDYIHRWCDEHGTRELLDDIRRSIPKT